MNHAWTRWQQCALVGLVLAGCGPARETPPRCVPGEVRECVCANGQRGRQICQVGGEAWEPCAEFEGDGGAQHRIDGGNMAHASEATDARPGVDAAVALDAGRARDAAVAVDAGRDRDAAVAVDAGGTPDATVAVDAGGVRDAAVAVDAHLPGAGCDWDDALSNVDSVHPTLREIIGTFVVTQVWNDRHMGIDVAMANQQDATGQPLYAIGPPGADVLVRCWKEPLAGQNVSTYSPGMAYAFDYAHMDSCIAGERGSMTVRAGDQIGTIGNSGSATTGAHLHFQQRRDGTDNPITGTHIPGWRGYLRLALLGLDACEPQ